MASTITIKQRAGDALERIISSPSCSRNAMFRRVRVLRWGLGLIYLWFGVLKLFPGLSSAEALAGSAIQIMTFGYLLPELSLPLLGIWESMIGIALLTDTFRRPAVISLYAHVAGTLAPLVILPELTWSTPPFAASLEGQYILKNLVTVGGALVVGAMTCTDKKVDSSVEGCAL